MFKNKKGFTMIELLVVISIIILLITVGLTSFSATQKKGRDAKRKADLRDIKNALEQYYLSCGMVYPTLNPGDDFYPEISCDSPESGPVIILPNMPLDPKTGTNYVCQDTASTCNDSDYVICTDLETNIEQYCISNSQ